MSRGGPFELQFFHRQLEDVQQREPLRDLVLAAQKAAAFYAHYSSRAGMQR